MLLALTADPGGVTSGTVDGVGVTVGIGVGVAVGAIVGVGVGVGVAIPPGANTLTSVTLLNVVVVLPCPTYRT